MCFFYFLSWPLSPFFLFLAEIPWIKIQKFTKQVINPLPSFSILALQDTLVALYRGELICPDSSTRSTSNGYLMDKCAVDTIAPKPFRVGLLRMRL